MLIRCIKAEREKLRHSVILPACILIPVIPAVMGTFNYLQNQDVLSAQWQSLWTQHTLFYACFFFAPLIGLYCSYLWRLEHRCHNWNMVMTAPVPVGCLFFAKLAVILGITVITQFWTGVLFLICGKLAGLPGFFPPIFLLWLLRGVVGAVPICALQLLLSMKLRSFSVPIGVGLLGSVIGLLIANEGLGTVWPYCLMLTGMNSNRAEDTLAGGTGSFLMSAIAYTVILCAVAVIDLRRRDVRA